jgi:hypothetical protein
VKLQLYTRRKPDLAQGSFLKYYSPYVVRIMARDR